jgi:NAD(P)-dependent dehydrogenase (short-subunit alcohol dehydrogenase family)
MTTTNELQDKRILVVGASRGLGAGMADALVEAGAHVTGLARNIERDHERPGLTLRRGDATDPTLTGNILSQVDPDIVLIVAGAAPLMRPLSQYDWEAFSANWQTDVKATFHWLKDCLTRPLRRGGRVIVISSGAARFGSPLSGGYAGAKQTQRFMVEYARGEAQERELGIRIQCVLPQLNPNTDLGAGGIRAYAARAGIDPQTFVKKRFGTPLSPTIAGASIVELLTSEDHQDTAEFMLSGKGLHPLDAS